MGPLVRVLGWVSRKLELRGLDKARARVLVLEQENMRLRVTVQAQARVLEKWRRIAKDRKWSRETELDLALELSNRNVVLQRLIINQRRMMDENASDLL